VQKLHRVLAALSGKKESSFDQRSVNFPRLIE
jgi:hypothetical protein